MCGICGIIGSNNNLGTSNWMSLKATSLMNTAIARQRPDDEGTFIDNGIGIVFVHGRLSIIKFSKNRHE